MHNSTCFLFSGVVLLALLAGVASFTAHADEPFTFQDNERIVFVGNTFFEREYNYGHIETLLTERFPDKHLTFRNLAWSGDNVWGASRAFFDTPKEGYQRLLQVVKEAKPTLIFFGYGQVESFETENTFEQFAEQLDVLLNDLEGTGARLVIVAPTLLEKLPAPLPDPAPQNERMQKYIEHLQGVAAVRKHYFLNLAGLVQYDSKAPLTDNTMHFTEGGYQVVAQKFLQGLGYEPPEEVEGLRDLVIEKNRLFFNKWRPQNETYIFGFRKHEQGQYQRETPMYDPLVEAVETQITEALAKAQPQVQE